MHVEHVTGDMYAVSTITIEERLNEDKGKENTYVMSSMATAGL